MNLYLQLPDCPSSQLPAELLRFYNDHYKEPPTAPVLRFLKHELVRKIWLRLLDENFMKAYKEGVVVRCGDGILRRLFLRLVVYSADYPEKYVPDILHIVPS